MSEENSIRLRQVAGISPETAEALGQVGVFTAEQLIGMADVPGVGEHLAAQLKVTADDLAAIVEAARGVAPPIELPQPTDQSMGALPPDPTAIAMMPTTVRAPPPAGLPVSVNLISKMSAIRDQGQRGTCVAFALTGVHELHRTKFGPLPDLSEQHLYHEAKRVDGSPGVCGTWQVKAVNVLQAVGECVETVWPYNKSPPCNNNGTVPGGAAGDAATRKCQPVILSPNDVPGAKALLAGGSAVGLSVPVYNSWYASLAVKKTGDITMRLSGEHPVGGHAVCLVGYQDNPEYPGGGYFLVRNSWGAAWAYASVHGAGYGTIPYDYVAQDGWELVSAA